MSGGRAQPGTNGAGSDPRESAVGPRLRPLLVAVLLVVALLAVNSVYLSVVRAGERLTGLVLQNHFFQWMFLLHLVLGLIFIPPLLLFGPLHARRAWRLPNRRAKRAGVALFIASLGIVITGLLLVRVDAGGTPLGLRDPERRAIAYWAHVALPLIAAWLFVLHRLAGPRIRWRTGVRWMAASCVVAAAALVLHASDRRAWAPLDPGPQRFKPSLARTADGDLIPADALMLEHYCLRCHRDSHATWLVSAHRFSSFNNPLYRFSVMETRRTLLERDGDVLGSRFCAGCHDTVPLFSGAFDDPDFDVDSPSALAGLTCVSCHSIVSVNSPRGNADFTIERAQHYPFALSGSPLLRWMSDQLVRANPSVHMRTFLKPVHRTPEFCSACHKVAIPEQVNEYRWLRGQNHFDSFMLSGVSGHGAASFYYPPAAIEKCADCHMPLVDSEQFGARDFDGSGRRTIHSHQFVGANTALPFLEGLPEHVNQAHAEFCRGRVRVDIFGLRAGGAVDGDLASPLRPGLPAIIAGERYLVEVVIRTLGLGHELTQGTADSNEVWLDVEASADGRVIGRSGGVGEGGDVDPWAHFVNVYMLDREGRRIDRRNVQDIFVPLYNNQVPPGAAAVVHYALAVPPDATGSVTLRARLKYRKFDAAYMRHVFGPQRDNDLPVLLLASDEVELPLRRPGDGNLEDAPRAAGPAHGTPEWERWNDYGIGLLRQGEAGGGRGLLRQAAHAFTAVESLGRFDGPINLARVHLREGELEMAAGALARAATFDPPPPPWTLQWLSGLIRRQTGDLDGAIADFEALLASAYPEARRRGFDFSRDYRVLVELGQALFEASNRRSGASREDLLRRAADAFRRALAFDPENLAAHHALSLALEVLGDREGASRHRAEHARYKVDDNARDSAVAAARARDPAAERASRAVVIHDLQRPGAPGLPSAPSMEAR